MIFKHRHESIEAMIAHSCDAVHVEVVTCSLYRRGFILKCSSIRRYLETAVPLAARWKTQEIWLWCGIQTQTQWGR